MPDPKGPDARRVEDKDKRPALPELKLTEIAKSAQPITELVHAGERVKEKLKIDKVLVWNNYTIVLFKDKTEIKIFDETGSQVDKATLSTRQASISWGGVPGVGGSYYIEKSSIPKMPHAAQGFAKELFAQKSSPESSTISKHATSDAIVLDKYIILTAESGGYFVYTTEDKTGVELSPDKWRMLSVNEKNPELEALAERAIRERADYRHINDKYSARVTGAGINILENSKINEAPVFSERMPLVERNIAVDPKQEDAIYYCEKNLPEGIKRLDMKGDPATWKSTSADFKNRYSNVHDLQLDPTSNFFLFRSDNDFVIVSKDSLEEVKRIKDLETIKFDPTGKIKAITKDGHLVIYEPNFEEVAKELEKDRAVRLAEGINIEDIFQSTAVKTKSRDMEAGGENLDPIKAKFESQFKEIFDKAQTEEQVAELRRGLKIVIDELKGKGLKPGQIAYVVSGIDGLIVGKEKEFAVKNAEEVIKIVKAKLAGGLSIAAVTEARVAMDTLKGKEILLDADTRDKVRAVAIELQEKSVELFSRQGDEVKKEINGYIQRARTDLEGFTMKSQMDDWLEFRYPKLKLRLGELAKDIPVEADETYKLIQTARQDLDKLAETFGEKFKKEYAKVREKVVERIQATVSTLDQDIHALVERLREKGFTDRMAAEQYLESSEAKKVLETEISGLATASPDLAKELQRALKVKISNSLTEIERGGMTKIADTGQQMVMFGKTLFPKWEAKVQERAQYKVDLVFEEDSKTRGPGVKASDVFGDIFISIRTSSGNIEKIPFFEGWRDENEWRLGLRQYMGKDISPSYITANDFKIIKDKYRDWSVGEKSKLRKELEEKKSALKAAHAKWFAGGGNALGEGHPLDKEYRKRFDEYAAFAADNHILILRHIDKIKTNPEIEYTNGRGFVPSWQSHWVMDTETDKDLEKMADALKMQLDLQEGLLNLKGHAGTGKDVRIKMFCALTNRPYFAVDGTKWTTEFELAEDVMLESKDGASQTVKIPSAVLNGITTPGAVVYFNEFNAMPEQAQIFLHALMDEKRSVSLKTSSGKTIKALPSVLLVGSMNPGYEGTFKPQFATRSRMISLEIDYPPLTREAGPKDKNRAPMYDSSEALRMARGIDSLDDLTFEASLDRNEFVQMWDHYVNGIDNDSPEPNKVQRFDLDASLSLVQFAHTLREAFVRHFEKSGKSRKDLDVSQPITGRELRRCAYKLSKMPASEKATANPETMAKRLLEEFFLTHIDDQEEREKIKAAMASWTSRKRVRA